MKSIRSRVLAFAVTAMFCAVTALRAGDGEAIRKVVESKTPSLVTVKFMLKVSMPGGEGDESEVETTGLMVSEDGLVLCANALLGGIMGIMSKLSGFDGQEPSMVPSDIKILIGDDTEGIEAKLLTRDTDLDLAWLKIKEPGDKKFAFVDITKGATAQMGDSLLILKRRSKFFDRAATFTEIRAAGVTSKPRDLILLDSDTGSSGHPVFTTEGEFAGFTIFQVPDSEESGMNPMSRFTMGDVMFPVILPAVEVAKATKNATASESSEKK